MRGPSRACSCDISGAGWASFGKQTLSFAAGRQDDRSIDDGEACSHCCGRGGERRRPLSRTSLAAEEHAEHARLRLRKEELRELVTPPSWGLVVDEASALPDEVAKVRWLAWSASCVDSMLSCGSTVGGEARISEERGAWQAESIISVSLEGCMLFLWGLEQDAGTIQQEPAGGRLLKGVDFRLSGELLGLLQVVDLIHRLPPRDYLVCKDCRTKKKQSRAVSSGPPAMIHFEK